MTAPELIPVAAGDFVMGAAVAPYPEDGEGPARTVYLSAYRIGACAVSNADFAEFVRRTGYVTTAETRGSSHVFFQHLDQPDAHSAPFADAPWWRDVAGAHWRLPDGKHASPPDHPVVHVSHHDALAFCDWSKTRLPSEAEWECAAEGSDAAPINIWQGDFPNASLNRPGPRAVRDIPPNAKGLYHACGNVWEWTADGFGRLHSPRAARNPGGNLGAQDKVVKGGSYLCAASYCARYRPSSRRSENPEASTCHTGFRVAGL